MNIPATKTAKTTLLSIAIRISMLLYASQGIDSSHFRTNKYLLYQIMTALLLFDFFRHLPDDQCE